MEKVQYKQCGEILLKPGETTIAVLVFLIYNISTGQLQTPLRRLWRVAGTSCGPPIARRSQWMIWGGRKGLWTPDWTSMADTLKPEWSGSFNSSVWARTDFGGCYQGDGMSRCSGRALMKGDVRHSLQPGTYGMCKKQCLCLVQVYLRLKSERTKSFHAHHLVLQSNQTYLCVT